MELGLEGKKALVTGSSRGLGYATALGLAIEGCDVTINSREPDNLKAAEQKLSERSSASIYSICSDLTKPGSPEKWYKTKGDLPLPYLKIEESYADISQASGLTGNFPVIGAACYC